MKDDLAVPSGHAPAFSAAGWIRFDQQMPPEWVDVLCYRNGERHVGRWLNREDGIAWSFGHHSWVEDEDSRQTPTHWMSLPAAPSGVPHASAESSEQRLQDATQTSEQDQTRSQRLTEAGFTRRPTGKNASGLMLEDAPALPPLPEPAWWADEYGTGKHGRRGLWREQQRRHSSGSEFFGVYTADQMPAHAESALEMAAKVCEAQHEEDRPHDYAWAVRALKQKE